MPADEHRVHVHLDGLLTEQGLTLTELADRVGITLANLSVLKNGRARAIRFTTLTALCDVLGCQPGDILRVEAVPDAVPGAEDEAGDEAPDAMRDEAQDAAAGRESATVGSN